MKSDQNGLGINSKDLEIILVASLTINFCVLWSLTLPRLCRVVLYGGSRTEENKKSQNKAKEIPILCQRFSTNLMFHVAMPVCGIILLTSTDVLRDPFFFFNAAFRLVFSMALGHYVFKTAEVLLHRHDVFHYKPLLVHHLVVVAMHITILKYEQNAILGLVSLFLEGALIFAELEEEDNSSVLSSHEASTRLRKIGTSVALIIAVALRGVVPVSLVFLAFFKSSKDLLQMSYVPLAFFFLSLVFFAAIDVWFFKDACAELLRQFMSQPSLPVVHSKISQVSKSTAVNNDGLMKLLKQNGGFTSALHITHNALWCNDRNLTAETPVLLPCEPRTPDEIKEAEAFDKSQTQLTMWM